MRKRESIKKPSIFYPLVWWRYIIVLLFSFFFGFPLVWMISSSFKSNSELVTNIWALPTNPNLDAYESILAMPEFKLYFFNSIAITFSSVTLLTILASMAAYVFARISIPGGNFLFYTFLAGMMIPLHITLIPLYAMLRDMGMLNNLISLLFPYVGFGLPLSIYILRGFFEQIPIELEEAARIDGASTTRIFWSIVLPLSRPALVTVITINMVGIWNEYLLALAFVSGDNHSYTLPLGVYSMVISYTTFQYDKALSALTLVSLPVLVFSFILQQQIIKSLARTIK